MAIVELSAFISDIRGKIGGSIFQKSASGLILRTNSRPINKNSISQNNNRNLLAQLQSLWQQLTDVERTTWTRFIDYNPIKQKNISRLAITGHNAFIKFNTYRLLYSLPILSTPSFTKCNITPVDLTLSLVGPVLTVTADRVLDSSNEFIVLSLTPACCSTSRNPRNSFMIMKFVTTDTDTFDLSSAYVSIFGRLPSAGNIVYMKYSNANNLSGLIFPFKVFPFTM